MFHIENLLKNEFFPAELPPCFSTVDLSIDSEEIISKAVGGPHYSIPFTYSGYKTESSRRKFALPNPYHYCLAVKFICEHVNEIKKVLDQSKYSLTAPIDGIPKANQPYAKRSNNVSETKAQIELLFQNNRYEIRLDINSFFDSIYTHSIPWAIHGIDVAKRQISNKDLWGNQLDKHMQSLNYNQTHGILVGNAVSRIVSEIILCTIDKKIEQQFPEISCRRFVDDYYIYVCDGSKVQEVISYVRKYLAQYELSLNENKVRIQEGPFWYGNVWVESIRQHIHLQPDAFLTMLIIEYNKCKDMSILRYGLKVISCLSFHGKNWSAIQSKLINLWVHFPSLADRILPILWKNKKLLKKKHLKSAICTIIEESLLLNREQELIWAVWFVKVFDVNISVKYYGMIVNSRNDPAIIIALDMIYSKGLDGKSEYKRLINRIHSEMELLDIDDDEKKNKLMWTSRWLVAYEATRNKWLKIPGKPFDFANKVEFFKELLNRNVKFYDSSFSYSDLQMKDQSHEFVSREELREALSELKQVLSRKKESTKKGRGDKISSIEEKAFQKLAKALNDDDSEY